MSKKQKSGVIDKGENTMINYKPLTSNQINEAILFWKNTSGVHLHDNGEDTKEGIELYIKRNPECSFIATDGGKIIGTILSGHDGRRGFINHLGVATEYRRQGIAAHLLGLSQDTFRKNGIHKCALFVLKENTDGQEFYEKIGWKEEDIVKVYCNII